MNAKAILPIAIIICIAGIAIAAENVYWLRGNDVTTYAEGASHYVMSGTKPNISSTKTDLTLETKKGEHEIARWYTTTLPQDFFISGTVYFWFRRMRTVNDSANYRFSIHDYDPGTEKSLIVAESNWLNIPPNLEKEAQLEIDGIYQLNAGHRAMLLLEYNAESGNGEINFAIDESKEGITTIWYSLNGNEYTLKNVDRAAAAILNLCPMIECGNNTDCDDSDDTTVDSCTNAGNCNARCVHERCDVDCLRNADCDDGNPVTNDLCIGKGSCKAYCTNEECGVECYNDSECREDSNWGECINRGTCLAECTVQSCEPGCASDGDCNDQDAATTDVCAGAGNCGAVCINMLSCGNKICDGLETECSCPGDCGNCGDNGNCEQYTCIGNSCFGEKKEDCCENNVCEFGEEKNCTADCGSGMSITLLGVIGKEHFKRGEIVTIKAIVENGAVPITNAELKASGFFGEIGLYNDGLHGDAEAFDSIYANHFAIARDTNQGIYNVTITASSGGEEAGIVKRYAIIPNLEIELDTDREEYDVGEYVNISGYVGKRNKPIETNVGISITVGEETAFTGNVKTNPNGAYSLSYRSNLLYPAGSWVIEAIAMDGKGNYGAIKKELLFSEPFIESLLKLEVIEEPNESYYRGESIAIAVSVKDDSGNAVNGAAVKAVTPGGALVEMQGEGTGVYRVLFQLGWDEPIGQQGINISALKIDENTTYGANRKAFVSISQVEYEIGLLEPVARKFAVGEEMAFRISLTYPDGSNVAESSTYAKIGEITVPLVHEGHGIYTARHMVLESELGKTVFTVNSTDPHGNGASLAAEIEVSGISIWYYLIKYRLSITAWAVAFLLAMGTILFIAWRKQSAEKLKKKRAGLLLEIKAVQTRYFKEGSLQRRVYDRIITGQLAELKRIGKKMRQLGRGKK